MALKSVDSHQTLLPEICIPQRTAKKGNQYAYTSVLPMATHNSFSWEGTSDSEHYYVRPRHVG
jgi:hypothetical protein